MNQTTAQTEAAAWLARRRNGTLGLRNQQDFLRWLNSAPENRLAFERAEAMWQALGGLDAGDRLDEARAFLARERRQRRLRRILPGLAASMVLGTAVWFTDPLSYLDDQTLRTAQGEHRSFTLADGSRLDLNTGSEARVHYSRRSREVSLIRGEIACDVTHEIARPFVVQSGAAHIRDIGTRFNVRQYPNHHSVSVLEGEVEVSTAVSPAQRLHRGEQIAYDAVGKLTAITAVDADSIAAWREGRIVFNGQPLRDVLAELARYEPLQLTVSAPLLDIHVSGAFSSTDPEQSLHTIAATLSARLTRTGPTSWRLESL